MGRQDRRERTALDEAFSYFKKLESGELEPDIFRLNKAVKSLAFALAVSDASEFKMTKQLWKRLHQALFDRMVTSFAGCISIMDEERNLLEIRTTVPESGYLAFSPEKCKRLDDICEIEISKLYPKTLHVIQRVWQEKGAFIKPSDFEGGDCDGGVCFMKPMVPGQDVLVEESAKGRTEAHTKWWELYWQAYCLTNKQEQEILVKQMSELESMWGNLYY